MKYSRRMFIGKSLASAAFAACTSGAVSAPEGSSKNAQIKIAPNDVILFQGDSITDAGRNRDDHAPNSSQALGNGYAFLAAGRLLQEHAGKQITVFNRGISGNKVHQLAERWDSDCIQIQPNVLSILIGVNDYWHTLISGYTGTIQVYRDDYRKLLDRTLTALPNVKLIIGEPFAVNNVQAVNDTWFPEFNEYRRAAQEIAKEYQAVFIPYQHIFDEAAKKIGRASCRERV